MAYLTAKRRQTPAIFLILHRFRFDSLVAQTHSATTGAEVVLTSTWRYDPAGVFSARNQGIPFIDTTPDLSGEARSREIIAWLEAHPEVERYIVIDDEDDELDALPLFQPLRSTGITDELVEAAAAFLNGESDKDMRRSKIVRLIQNVGSILRGHVGVPRPSPRR